MSDLLSPVLWARWEHYEGTPGRYVTRKWTCRVESSAVQGNSLASQGGPHAAVPVARPGAVIDLPGENCPGIRCFARPGRGLWRPATIVLPAAGGMTNLWRSASVQVSDG